MKRPTNPYAVDGVCHNVEPGTLGHECGKPAVFLAIRVKNLNGAWGTGFCGHCREYGAERHGFDIWLEIPFATVTRELAETFGMTNLPNTLVVDE